MKKNLLLFFVWLAFSPVYATDYHVSKSGSDSNNGSASSPFLTITKAASLAIAGDNVYIHEGTYEEEIAPANSGTSAQPITFQSYNNDKVIVTAMQALSGWVNDNGNIYKTQVNWDLGQYNMVMNGSSVCDLARWPNNTDGDPFTLNSAQNTGGSGSTVVTGAYLQCPDIPNYNWSQGGSLFFFGGGGWTAWKEWITSSSSGRVNFNFNKSTSWIISAHCPSNIGEFYLEGIKEALDYQNEWYYNSSTKTLYIQLPNGAAPVDNNVQMRRRILTVNLNGKNYIHIKNMALFGGSIEISGKGNYIYGVTSLYGNHTRGIAQSAISNSQSIFIKWNSEDNKIEKCEIAFGSGSGIRDAGIRTQILNNNIHDFDNLGDYDAVVLARDGNTTTIIGNTISRGGRDALQIVNKNSEVANNDISYSNLIATDCGLLYSIGTNLNMEIHHNYFHDGYGRGSLYKAAGIYLDNDAADVSVHHNVVLNTDWTSIQINWNGTNIDVFNNTLWNGSEAMGAWHKEGTSFSDVRVWNNLTNKNSLEPQSDKRTNSIITSGANPFTNLSQGNLTLTANATTEIDKGTVIAGITDGYTGSLPDIGAYEYGQTAWSAGIDWDPVSGPTGNGCYGLPGENCSSNTQTPYNGNPSTIPGTIEIEDYDLGGNNVAYYDNTIGNAGGKYRTDDVDIEMRDGGYTVGWTKSNEWLEYTTNVEAGSYKIEARVAAVTAGKRVKLWLDNTELGTFTVPNTGNWGTFQTISLDNISLTGGNNQVLKVEFLDGGVNINWVTFIKLNLISNNGFELGNLTSWNTWGNVSVVSNNQNTGNYAVYVNGAGAPSQVISLKANTTYTVFAYGKVGGSGQSVLLGVKNHGAAESSTSLTSTQYSQVAHTFTTGADGSNSQIYFYVPNGAYKAWGDDFELYEGNLKSATITIESNTDDLYYNLYPNPTSGIVHIESNDQSYSYQVYSIQGKLIMSKTEAGSNDHFNLSNFGRGVYIVKISGSQKPVVKLITVR